MFASLTRSQKAQFPGAVRESYQSPIIGSDLIKQKQEYDSFQTSLITLLWDYVRFCEKRKKTIDQRAVLPDHQTRSLSQGLEALGKRIKNLAKEAFRIFDDKTREKTLVMAVDEYLFNFLQQIHTHNKAYTTL